MRINKYIRKTIAMLLVICMTICAFPAMTQMRALASNVSENDVYDVSTAQKKDWLSSLLSPSAENMKILSRNELSEYIDYEVAYAKGHVKRLTNLETLNTLVYLNKNNTKTVYFFEDDIKFYDENGNLCDKNVELKETADGYATKKNNISLTLPNSISDGLGVAYKGNKLTLIPIPENPLHKIENAVTQFKNSENKMKYSSVFDGTTDITYTPTLNGVKEEIVLSKYNGTNSWSFLAKTNGMYSYCDEDGIYYFAESEDAKERFSLGQVFVYDSACNIDGGTMKVTEVKSGEYYMVTIEVSKDFLTDENTVYPVYVDPQVEINNANSTTNILDTTIYSVKSSTNTGTWALNHAGLYNNTYGVGRILVKLPGLTSSADYIASSASDILNATFYICEATGTGGQSFSIHAFTGANWTETGARWNNVNPDSYVSTAVATATPASRAYGAFDITSLVREWKNGTKNPDYGFILKNTNETNSAVCRAFIANNHVTTTQRPKLSVTYRDKTSIAVSSDMGVNDTYTYDVTSLDNAVKNNVSHAKGNLVSINSFDVKVKDFPLSVGYVFNSKLYANSASSGDFYKYNGITTNYKMGKGWKLSLIELMRYDSANDRYVYTDAYGTEYSFEKDNGTYKNAALGAELTVNSDNTVTLEDGNITRKFNTNGLVASIAYDEKTYTYNYTGTYALSSITCNGSTLISFTYTSNNLTGVGNYTITYDSSLNVTKISDSYSNIHEYQTSASSFAVRRSVDGYAYTYAFDSSNRVNSIKYCRYANSAYNTINETKITYAARQTVYSTSGADYNFSTTADNIYTTFVFDGANRTLYSVEKLGSEIHNAMMYGIAEDEGGNKTASSVSGGGSENYLDNSSFETTASVTSLTRATDKVLLGSYSAKFTSAANSYFTANLAPGTYTFSVYVKLNNVKRSSSSSAGGAYAEVKNSSGSVISHSGYFIGTNDEKIGNGWYRIFATFTVTAQGAYTLNFGLRNATGTMYADCAQLEKNTAPTMYNALSYTGAEQSANPWSSTTDSTIVSSQAANGSKSFQVNAGKTVYREVPVNANVTSTFVISGWAKAVASTTAGYGIDVMLKYSDNTSETIQLRFDGSYTDWQYQCYEVSSSKDSNIKISNIRVSLVNATSSAVYFDNILLSMAMNSVFTDDDSEDDNTTYSTGLAFTSKGDGTCSLSGIGSCTDTVLIVPPKSPAGDTVTVVGDSAFKYNAVITKVVLPDTITDIRASAFWGCTAMTSINIPYGVEIIRNWAFYNCLSLVDVRLPDTVKELQYKCFAYCKALRALNIPKNVKTFGEYVFNTTTLGLYLYYEGTIAEYEAITKGTGAIPETVTLRYNSNIIGDIAYIYTYDSNKNVTSTTMKYVGSDTTLANGTDVLYTSSTYDANGNCLTYTDEAGNKTTYTYDSHGNVLTVKDANGITTTYTYNSNGLVSTMTRQTAKNTYTYTNGLLTKIVHSDTATSKSETYNITYDVYGNIKTISVGSQTLVSYDYANNGAGHLTKTTYGNGNYETYTYDAWDNVIKQYFGTTLKYEYAYDVNGTVVTAIDHETGRVKKQVYAANDELVGTVTYNKATYMLIVLEEGSLYKFDDATTSEFTGEYDYVYDALGRTKTETLKNGSKSIITKTFDYVDKTNSTNLVGSEGFSNGSTFSYEYDALNRLTIVKENGTIKLKYTYDAMGRLEREDNAYSNKSYKYEYTTNGNILSKKTYAYTTGTLGAVQSTETRAYGNSNWLDQLTNINGTAITYDNMGNPLKWHNASSLTWEGRKLKTFTKTDGTVISYTYDENGIRTGKKIGSENVEYVLSGTKIVQEKRANYTLTFLYDGNTLVGFNYKAGTTNADYYYGIDNFGNINYIYDANGNIVVTYRYDAWGKAIATIGSLAGTIGAINPYRYKSYYYDQEIQMYYLQSRYYDAGVQRFVSPDEIEFLGASVGVYAFNLYAYCENDPINFEDSTGNGLLGALVLKGAWYAFAAAVSQALVVAVVVVVVVAVVVIATTAVCNYAATKASTKTKTLSDVKVKAQSGKHYQLAYITTSGGMCRIGERMDFVEALAILGVTGATNSITKRYTYNRGSSSEAQRQLEHMGSGNWGIYADSQIAAKALAVVFGWTDPPEVHGSGMYGHYHDSTHTFHIWYGGHVSY